MKINKTLVCVPDGYNYIEITHVGDIIAKPMKDINKGAAFDTVIIDEIQDATGRLLNNLKEGKTSLKIR